MVCIVPHFIIFLYNNYNYVVASAGTQTKKRLLQEYKQRLQYYLHQEI